MTARDYALIELDGRTLPHWPAGLLRRAGKDSQPPADPRDRALAEQIIRGVVKNLLHLQFLTEHYAQRPLKKIDPLAQKVLAVGMYQLRFLERIPASAAVNEAVEQARRFGRARAAGFINAVLRNVQRQPQPALPDRKSESTLFAERVLSHPRELFERLTRLVGLEDALRICEHDNREPPTILRLYASGKAADLQQDGIEIHPHEHDGMFIIHPARPAVLADLAERGIAQVQDPTAAGVVPQLQVKTGQAVLDRCCGLGTKTLQMRDRLGENGLIVAMDPAGSRIRTLGALVAQRKLANIQVHQAGQMRDLPKNLPLEFDRALIDAPCSNSGVMARRAESRYSQTDDALRSLEKLQDEILADTAPAVKPGGLLLYSTCSIWPEENQQRVQRFLSNHPQFTLVGEQATLPSLSDDESHYHDGGYYAVLEKSSRVT